MVESDRSHRRWGRRATGVVVALAVGAGLCSPAAAADEPSADLSVGVSHTPDDATTGDMVSFTITAANAGPDTADAVVAGLGIGYPLDYRSIPESCSVSPSNRSLVCQLGDIAAGASESVTVEVLAGASGLFTVPAAVASPTADPTPDDRTTTDVVLVSRGDSQAVRYLKGIFPLILERAPGTPALEYWGPRWVAARFQYPPGPIAVPLGIMASDEYRRLRVRASYERILGRSADPSGLASWVRKARGGMRFERIEQHLVGSREFARTNAGAEVDAVYQVILGRAPNDAERAAWQAHLDEGGSPGGIAGMLQRSTEGYNRIIEERFASTLGRAPELFDRYIWQVRLREGWSPERLWAEMLISGEFLRDYPLTEDDYEDYIIYNFEGQAAELEAALAAAG